MSDKIGKLYTPAEIEHIAKARAVEDSKQDGVIWTCAKCLQRAMTPVSKKITSRQCRCGTWMYWYYRPKQVA